MTGTLAAELADSALSFARAHATRSSIDRAWILVADPAIQRADMRVDARFADALGTRPTAAPAAHDRADTGDADREPSDTRVFEVPKPPTPRAILQVRDPDGRPAGSWSRAGT
jgi:hypothetical protein